VHILVVDDSDDLREILEFILKSKGADVESARDGAEAINKVQSSPYDIILMDMRMPGLDGNDTALKIRNTSSAKLKIIALTGDVDGAKFLRKESPFNAYVVKPIDPANLSVSIIKTMDS
jgi:CheY-like chemotaxis protein